MRLLHLHKIRISNGGSVINNMKGFPIGMTENNEKAVRIVRNEKYARGLKE